MINPVFNGYSYQSSYVKQYPQFYNSSLFNTAAASSSLMPSFDPARLLSAAQEALAANSWSKAQPTATAKVLTALNDKSSDLWQASKELTDAGSSVFYQKAVTSSQPKAVSGTAQDGAAAATYNVSVTQVAAAQQNVGQALNSSTVTGNSGVRSFAIQSNGKTVNVSFNQNSWDSNETVLNKMATAINAAGAGVTAGVVTDTKAGTSKLVLTSAQTGTKNSFTITDTVGSAVTSAGAGTVTTAAVNASYLVNGVAATSQSNTVSLDNGKVTLNLQAPAAGATLSVSPDTAAVSSAVNDFVKDYNSMQKFVAQYSRYLSPDVAERLKDSYNKQASALKEMGVTRNTDGTLSVNQDTLNKAITTNMDKVKSTMAGRTGLATTAGALAKDLATSPLTSYANAKSFANTSFTDLYSSFRNTGSSNLWSLLMPAGQFFNFTV